MILAIETATPATTVALVREGEVLAHQTQLGARRHAEVLMPAVSSVLRAAGTDMSHVETIAVGVGPGAFTGLRVGLATAQSLGQALGVPVFGVMTLDVMAFESEIPEPFVVVTDARRKEVFWAEYANATTRLGEPMVNRPDDVAQRVLKRAVVGVGGTPFVESFPRIRKPDLPSAAALARLVALRVAEGGELLPPLPIYLRQPDVGPSARPKSVLT